MRCCGLGNSDVSCCCNFFGLFALLIGLFISFMAFSQNFPLLNLRLIGPSLILGGSLMLVLGWTLWWWRRRAERAEEAALVAVHAEMSAEMNRRHRHRPDCLFFAPLRSQSLASLREPQTPSSMRPLLSRGGSDAVSPAIPTLLPDDSVWLPPLQLSQQMNAFTKHNHHIAQLAQVRLSCYG